MSTRGNKGKQHRYTLADKINVLERLEHGDKQTEIEMDTGIPVKTQQRWTKQRKILFAQNKGTTPEETYEIVETDGGERHGFIGDTPETNIKQQTSTPMYKNVHDIPDIDTNVQKTTLVYKDTHTGEEILRSDNCVVYEGTWKAGEDSPSEVILEVDRGKDNPKPQNNPKPESKLVDPTDNPNNTVDQVKEIMSNDWVKILVPLGIGAAGWLWKRNQNGAQNEADW